MVRRGGYVGEWTHKGPVVKGKHARRFKLVSVGYCASFEEVKRKLKPHGKIPEGQWREAFRTVYPKSDGKGPIGVADSSWARPGGDALFPCVGIYGDSRFDWAVIVFSGDWRWLVEVESE